MKRFQLLFFPLLCLAVAACAAPQVSPTQLSAVVEPTVLAEQPPDEAPAVVEPTNAVVADQAEGDQAAPDAETSTEAVAEAVQEMDADSGEVAEAAPASEPADWLAIMGRTDEGLATLGNPDAAVTLIDYSDFM